MNGYDSLTQEELIELLNSQETKIKEITAERDSYKEENEALKEKDAEREQELANTRKLNYTLARQVDTKKKSTFEETLVDMYGKKAR